jgi:putative transposase
MSAAPSPPHSRDLRKGRVSESGRIYHLRTSTARPEPLFADLFLGREVVAALRLQHDQAKVQSLAFVVMPTHLHWLVQLQGNTTLDGLMQAVKGASARGINQRLGRSGPLWQEGYFDRALRAEDDVRAIARYIIANPLRARLCKHIGDYPLWDAIWV